MKIYKIEAYSLNDGQIQAYSQVYFRNKDSAENYQKESIDPTHIYSKIIEIETRD